MLCIFLNRLKSKVEELLAEENTGFRAERAQWNEFSIAEPSARNTCITNVYSFTTSSTLRKRFTACGMMAYERF
ncbi:hypothetical protein DPMN_010725 [Dreissena polymorpha]|uniref:Uncharacterized protein n=1 Tax=Dreissena polymorpha TaxID=45954 RepID=A0A9D4S1S7_DREPO|nr:hypothetical protein DPMN_010725 [Dreissena polymorpha]